MWLDTWPGDVCWGLGQKCPLIPESDRAVFSVPLAISSLLASVTLDLSQYAPDIVKGLASEYATRWVLVVLAAVLTDDSSG
jgi:hypothetical protein